MSRWQKIEERILLGRSDASISFDDMMGLLSRYGFSYRVRGSHHIFAMSGVEELINIQRAGDSLKPYQVKQIRNIIIKYKLGGQH